MIDIQISLPRRSSAVLALVVVSQHQGSPCEPHIEARSTVEARQQHYARNSEPAPNDGKPVVQLAHWQRAPALKVVQVAAFVHCRRGASEKQGQSTACGGNAYGSVEAIQQEHWKAQPVHHWGDHTPVDRAWLGFSVDGHLNSIAPI